MKDDDNNKWHDGWMIGLADGYVYGTGNTLQGQLRAELKIFFIYVKAWQDHSGLGQDYGISSKLLPGQASDRYLALPIS